MGEQTMALYGYARVSSTDQDTTIQEEALHRAGCEVIRVEKASGTTRNKIDTRTRRWSSVEPLITQA